jgi:hypothetical protein
VPIDGQKYTIEGCIPTYFHWRPDKTDFTNQNIKFLCPVMIGFDGHRWWKSSGHN